MRKGAAMLRFNSDKEKYNVGDDVRAHHPQFRQRSRAGEHRDRQPRARCALGEAEGKGNALPFRHHGRHGPERLRARDARATAWNYRHRAMNDLPIRLYGVIPIMVEDASHAPASADSPRPGDPHRRALHRVREREGRRCR